MIGLGVSELSPPPALDTGLLASSISQRRAGSLLVVLWFSSRTWSLASPRKDMDCQGGASPLFTHPLGSPKAVIWVQKVMDKVEPIGAHCQESGYPVAQQAEPQMALLCVHLGFRSW